MKKGPFSSLLTKMQASGFSSYDGYDQALGCSDRSGLAYLKGRRKGTFSSLLTRWEAPGFSSGDSRSSSGIQRPVRSCYLEGHEEIHSVASHRWQASASASDDKTITPGCSDRSRVAYPGKVMEEMSIQYLLTRWEASGFASMTYDQPLDAADRSGVAYPKGHNTLQFSSLPPDGKRLASASGGSRTSSGMQRPSGVAYPDEKEGVGSVVFLTDEASGFSKR